MVLHAIKQKAILQNQGHRHTEPILSILINLHRTTTYTQKINNFQTNPHQILKHDPQPKPVTTHSNQPRPDREQQSRKQQTTNQYPNQTHHNISPIQNCNPPS